MSKPSATRPRPLSPHLQVYRLIPTMAMSIIHRITGGALYVGMLLVAWWLVAVAGSRAHFELVDAILASWFGRLVLFGFTWAMVHHLLGGVRHLVWDTGAGLEPRTSTRMAWATLICSIALTILIWIAAYAVKGGS